MENFVESSFTFFANSNDSSFTQVTSASSGLKVSALHNVLEQFIAENAPELANYKITHSNNEQRPAYYIESKEPMHHQAFESIGYKPSSAHLSLDKYFKETSTKSLKHHGLNIAHNTEIHINTKLQKKIIARTYFTSHGTIDYTQAKQYTIGDDTNFTEISLYAEMESLIKENCVKASNFLTLLLRRKNELYTAAVAKAQ